MTMTPGQLYDELHALFGIGDYDDLVDGATPWHKVRMTEIAKLKGMLKRRHCTVEEVHIAAQYAYSEGKPITAAWQVFLLVPEALKAKRETARALAQGRAAQELLDAVAEAVEAGDMDWAERLMRTPPQYATGVLDEWRTR